MTVAEWVMVAAMWSAGGIVGGGAYLLSYERVTVRVRWRSVRRGPPRRISEAA